VVELPLWEALEQRTMFILDSLSRKTMINVLSYGIKIWTELSFVLSQITRFADRQTDSQTSGSWLY